MTAKANILLVSLPPMRLRSIETTPNPNSMKLNLEQPVGKAVTYSAESREDCPEVIGKLIDIDGIKSVFVCGDFLTLNKDPRADWRLILDAATRILGEDGSSAIASVEQRQGAEKHEQVQVLVQTFRGIPIQIKVVDPEGEKRISLPARFNEAAMLVQEKTGADYLKERYWADWGVRYGSRDVVAAEVADEINGTIDEPSFDRIKHAALGEASKPLLRANNPEFQADLRSEDWHKRLRAIQELGTTDDALPYLIEALSDSNSQVRRFAAAALGATGNAAAVAPLCKAFTQDSHVGVRRTAGDALSDLGDCSAQAAACTALADPSRIVRWRAARILFELGTAEAIPFLEKLQEDPEFEVRLEIAAACQRIGEGGQTSSPAWKKMIDNVT
jgi:hypothetical protein